MIFIVLGTQKFQCNRLLKIIDKLILDKKITEKVFAQVGYSDYIPKYFEYTQFLNKEEFEIKINECDLLITHGGVGTIISGINKGKAIIVFPRLKKYNEHVDDHQLEIAYAFANKKFVLMYKENNELDKLIERSKAFKYERYVSSKDNINMIISNFLEQP